MTHTYHAIELTLDGHEYLFSLEAETQGGAEWLADMNIYEMAECHRASWFKFGRVIRDDEYLKQYPQTNESAVRY